jgi:chorismate mutase
MTQYFDLSKITALLEGLEETIIFKLIDRAQFRHNPIIYQPGKSGFVGSADHSLFSLRLRYQEKMDALFGRFCVPEERPFFTGLPKPRRKVTLPPTGLHCKDINTVNLAKKISEAYLALVPALCRHGDDGHYGSSVEHDVYALQAIARRIHYGSMYVAESKFLSDPARYCRLVREKNREGILALLTRRDVEERIVKRIRDKVDAAQSGADRTIRHAIDSAVVLDFYRECIIPLTKEGEVLYLLNRTEGNA